MRRQTIEDIEPELIHVTDRLRPVSSDRVAALANSIAEIGLRTPISVVIRDDYVIDGQREQGVPVLVAGAHRLEAVKKLGWKYIQCVVLNDDDAHAELWQIDENLARAELTPSEQAEHLKRRKELWSQVGQVAPPSKPQYAKGFAQDVADKTGLDKRNINKAIARAENTTPEARDVIRNTHADTGANLDRLAKLPKPEQVAVAREMVAQQHARPALNQFESVERQVDALMRAWNAAGPEAREQFLERIDRPVFDRTDAA